MGEAAQNGAAQIGQFGRIVGADVEDAGFLILFERVEPHGKEHHLARAARSLEQAGWIGVETGGRLGIDLADMVDIAMVAGRTVGGLGMSPGAKSPRSSRASMVSGSSPSAMPRWLTSSRCPCSLTRA
jgi:hypothetical protein